MQALLEFFKHSFHWIVFLLLEVVSGVLLFRYNSYQGSLWLSSANVVAGRLCSWGAAVAQFFTLQQANEELSARNVFLEQQLTQLRERLKPADNEAEAVAADSVWSAKATFVQAHVVSNSLSTANNLITIDRGTADGIAPDMGVACGNGVVGVVYMAGQHYAIVLPVLNRRSRISCRIRSHDYFGYLSWEGQDAQHAYLEDIPRHAKFKKGDWVETSGYSDTFPAGVAVGKVVAIYNSADGLSYRLKVQLSTDFACLRNVCVFNDPAVAERLKLEALAADSLATAP